MSTTIVPVYADFEATKACIESLLESLSNDNAHRVIIVNDASPDHRIRKYLASRWADERVQILTNERNLGFVGSINRAMAEVVDGDIVLLNADTVVPNGFVDRLAAATRTAPDIGTVTPLSNNGEFTSFPRPYAQNPLPSVEEMRAIDRIAANVNAGRTVDMPNGIGFCLYITRACLDAVGSLSTDYHRGYFEDVDFCLRARSLGFRNVCAPAVFVGHAGSRSFRKDKRSLVVRNLAVLEAKFSDYRAECAAFLAQDPLQPVRQAIELATPFERRERRLLVVGSGAGEAVAYDRARQLLSKGEASLVLTVRRTPCGLALRIREGLTAVPQSIDFDLTTSEAWETLIRYLRAAAPRRIEYPDLASTPKELVDRLCGLHTLQERLTGGNSGFVDPALHPHGRSHGTSYPTQSPPLENRRKLNGCQSGPDALLEGRLRDGAVSVDLNTTRRNPAPDASHRDRRCFAIVPVTMCVRTQQLIREVVVSLTNDLPNISIMVLGSTLDDYSLMRIGQTFVTGPIDSTELAHLSRVYSVCALFLCATRPVLGHPIQTVAADLKLPLAYIDWHTERYCSTSPNLRLTPHAKPSQQIGELRRWLQIAHPSRVTPQC